MPEPSDSTAAARWLLAEFDATDPADRLTERYDYATDDYWCPVHVQEMFTLKSVMDHGATMRVTRGDYADPVRWWL